jgi:hypothetical protein
VVDSGCPIVGVSPHDDHGGHVLAALDQSAGYRASQRVVHRRESRIVEDAVKSTMLAIEAGNRRGDANVAPGLTYPPIGHHCAQHWAMSERRRQ